MPYSTADQVRAIIDTDVEDHEITELIEESDAYMDLVMNTAALDVIVLRMISRQMTAVRCMTKDPTSSKIGEYSEDREASLKKMNAMLDEMIEKAAAAASPSGGIGFRYSYAQVPRSYSD